MSLPTLTPKSTTSAIVLPATGSANDVDQLVPYRIYSDSTAPNYSSEFLNGAADQVSYVYKKLGGDVLDIELTAGNVYSAYEEAVLEYSYLVNIHQATNILSDALGNTTGSFDSKGNIEAGDLASSLNGTHVALKYPKFDYSMTRRIAEGVGSEIGLNSSVQYSASFPVTAGIQDYNLQEIISDRANYSVATITISDYTNITAGNTSVVIKSTDDTTITATAHAENNEVAGADSSTFKIGANNTETASNLKNVLNAHAKLIATSTDNVITVKQVTTGSAGDTDITVNDPGDIGITKTNFTGGKALPYAGKINGKRILIKKVYYKTPHAMWRFYGYYGGLNVVGNLHNYGQFSDDSTFQLIPAWHNKAQAMAFEDAIYTRMSHFSYELRNNNVRIHPIPYTGGPTKMWVEFSVPTDVWDSEDTTIDGVNNMNTLPMGNLPYKNINAIGKQWIRRFALALCKETLGQVRSKFGSVPIPGESVTLNGSALITEGKDEQEKLREELKTTLAELTYAKLAEQDAGMLDNTEKVLEKVPNYIFVG